MATPGVAVSPTASPEEAGSTKPPKFSSSVPSGLSRIRMTWFFSVSPRLV